MRIGLKITLALVVPLVTLILLFGLVFQLRSRDLLRRELAREGRAIARVVAIAGEDYLRDGQVADLRELAERISGYERVLGVRLFDQEGRVTHDPDTLSAYPFRHWNELRQVMAEGRTIEMRRSVNGGSALGVIVPLLNPARERVGALQVLQLESYIDEDERATREFILQLTLVVALAIIVIVLVVTRASISRPIERLVRSFREIGARDVPSPVPVRGDDELSWLSREFNGMCARLQSARESLEAEQAQRREVEDRLHTAERLAALGRLAAGLAHEIGTPLNVILGRAESVRRSLAGQEPADRELGIVVSQSERIARIVRDMLAFARMKPRPHVPTDVGRALTSALDLLDERSNLQGVLIERRIDGTLPLIRGDADRIQQVFINLAVNALDAMPDGGRLTVDAAAVPSPPGRPGRLCLRVDFQDDGAGIASEHLERVFDPFFSTKDARGTGLGLSVSYGIVEEHGGWFETRSHEGEGSCFSVFLPVADPE